MTLIVCATCRRHHRIDETRCPFCANAVKIGLALSAALIASACARPHRQAAVYGGPPDTFLELAAQPGHPVLDLFEAHARAAGCLVERQNDTVIARCAGEGLAVTKLEHGVRLHCETPSTDECVAAFRRIERVKLTEPVAGVPIDAPILGSPESEPGALDAGAADAQSD